MKTSGASLPCNQVILPEWSYVVYAWKRGVNCECVGRNPRRHCAGYQPINNYDGRDFWYKKVLSRPRKADNDSEEQICRGREFQMVGEAKENDLRPISDRTSGTILVGRSKRSWRNVWCNQIINVCWLLERWNFKSKCGNLKFITGGKWQPMKLDFGSWNVCLCEASSQIFFELFCRIYVE